MAQQSHVVDPLYSHKIGGCLLLLVVGVVALFFIGLPTTGPVMCGSDVMYPGDVCWDGGIPIDTDGNPRSNYDAMAAENAALHAGSPPAVVAGSVMIALGGGLLIRVVRSRNRRTTRSLAPPSVGRVSRQATLTTGQRTERLLRIRTDDDLDISGPVSGREYERFAVGDRIVKDVGMQDPVRLAPTATDTAAQLDPGTGT